MDVGVHVWLGFSLLSLFEVPILSISLRILGLFNFIQKIRALFIQKLGPEI
jgi:hypothetical protein